MKKMVVVNSNGRESVGSVGRNFKIYIFTITMQDNQKNYGHSANLSIFCGMLRDMNVQQNSRQLLAFS